jgi:hypothetical protein
VSLPVYGKLSATSFPETLDDMSFTHKMQAMTDTYKPLLDMKVYRELGVVPGEEFFTDALILSMEEEEEQQEQDAKTMTPSEYCKAYPYDDTKCEVPKTEPEIKYVTPFTGRTLGGGEVIENYSVTGGSCYPPERVHTGLSNKIMTTGRYVSVSPAFEKGLITVFRKEGHCGKIKNDPGRFTCYGITEVSAKSTGMTLEQLAKITIPEAEDWYYKYIWKPFNIGQLPDVISTDYFLAAMGSGPGTAYKEFTSFLGIRRNRTYKVDSAMINAVKNYNGDIHNRWMDRRNVFLQQVAKAIYKGSVKNGYSNAIDLKRKNGCHVRPKEPIYR